MGGPWSRRWRYGYQKRTTVEECLSIDVRRLNREGLVRLPVDRKDFSGWYHPTGPRAMRVRVTALRGAVELSYNVPFGAKGRWPDLMEYRVDLDWTPCHFGGERPWFVCPGADCGRRVAHLYLPPKGNDPWFLCRHCHGLAYDSQNGDGLDGLYRRVWQIRRRLGAVGHVFSPLPPRAKGMHRRTYTHALEEYCQLLEGISAREGVGMARLEDKLVKLGVVEKGHLVRGEQ